VEGGAWRRLRARGKARGKPSHNATTVFQRPAPSAQRPTPSPAPAAAGIPTRWPQRARSAIYTLKMSERRRRRFVTSSVRAIFCSVYCYPLRPKHAGATQCEIAPRHVAATARTCHETIGARCAIIARADLPARTADSICPYLARASYCQIYGRWSTYRLCPWYRRPVQGQRTKPSRVSHCRGHQLSHKCSFVGHTTPDEPHGLCCLSPWDTARVMRRPERPTLG
jgi:hypothetical protein